MSVKRVPTRKASSTWTAVFLGLCAFFLAPFTAAALGTTEESAFDDVTGEENWSQEIPVDELEPGTYNVLVRATDMAGNQSFGGPVNVVVDPASDIPTVGISTPTAGAVVGERLVVLGTAADDDEIDQVTVQLNDQEPRVAEGSAFWSLSFDLSEASEGVHTLQAVATDINGLESPAARVSFRLDTSGPTISVDTPASGDFASATIRVDGSVRDENGVRSLTVRHGDAADETSLRVRNGRTLQEFSHRLDTTEFEDGPLVLWFTATDSVGSVTEFPRLVFVDNTAPAISLRDPIAEVLPAGTIRFTGSVTDEVGLAGLEYETSHGEAGQLEQTPGDPYWTASVDFSESSGRETVVLRARDVAGNSAVLERTIRIDAAADAPTIRRYQVSPEYLFAVAEDDDGIRAIEYRIGEGDWRRTPTDRSTAIALEEQPPGTRTVSIRAVDVFGKTGPVVESSVEVPADPPLLADLRLQTEDPEGQVEEERFRPGFVLYDGETRTLSGLVESSWNVDSLEYRFDDEESWSTARLRSAEPEGAGRFEIRLGLRQDPGRHRLRVRALNQDGQGDALDFVYYVLERMPEERDPEREYVTEIPDAPGLYLTGGRVNPDTRLLHFRGDRPLTAFAIGGEIDSARLQPPAEDVELSVSGSSVSLTPSEPVFLENRRLVVNVEGTQYESDPLDLLYDPRAPTVRYTSPAPGAWQGEGSTVRVEVAENLGGVDVSRAVGDEAFTALRAGEDGSYEFFVPPPEEDGSVLVRVRAEDRAGNATVTPLHLNFDTTRPQLAVISPAEGDQVNGRITVAGRADDGGAIEVLDWALDEESARTLQTGTGTFSFSVDLTRFEDEEDRPVIRAVDRAGNEARLEMAFPIAVEEDKPRVSVQLPPDQSVQREDFSMSGTAFDDDGIAEILASFDGGEFQSVGAGDTFSIPVDVTALGDNEHTVTVKAVDLGGVESDETTVRFSVSLESPVGAVTSPELAQFVRDEIEIRGNAEDANGIESVRLSFDNGSSYVSARSESEEPFAEWSYPLKSAVLTDGLHSVQIELVDGLGTRSLFSTLLTVDNAPPRVELDQPAEGSAYYGSGTLSGRVRDAQQLEDLELRLTPYDDAGDAAGEPAAVITDLDLASGGVLERSLDLSDLEPGRYNLSLAAWDASGNEASSSRNIVVRESFRDEARIEVYNPVYGAETTSVVTVEGRVFARPLPERVIVSLNGESVGVATVRESGFFSFELESEMLQEGRHELTVRAGEDVETGIVSRPTEFRYRPLGPWVSVESHESGDTVGSRPLISGTADYEFEEPDGLDEGSREYSRAVREYEVTRVEVSLDNGASYSRASGTAAWEYRIETGELADGWHPVIVRTIARNGREALRRMQLQIDTAPPVVQLESPGENERFNDVVTASGTAIDNNGLDSVEIVLRDGNLNRYEVPEFIQGLYADFHFLGASTWDAGLGLTFFDDNVKLQGQIGVSPPGRFSGLVLGGKLLANVARLPFSAVFGPDWSFLAASLAVGANFSYFTMSDDTIGFTDEGLVLAGIVGQLEFPIFSVDAWRALNAYSFYTEGQLWFISSDIEGGVQSKISFGVRVQLL